jgi:hypothetical protein
MNTVEREAFAKAYANNVAHTGESEVMQFLTHYFNDEEKLYGSENYTTIVDALGIWGDAKSYQKETSALYYIEKTFAENTGGGCMVDFIQLKDGRCIGLNDECMVVYPSYNLFYHDHLSTINFPVIKFEPCLQERHEPYCPSNDGFPCKCWDIDYIAEVALNSACAKIQEMLDVPTGDLAGEVFSGQKGENIGEILKDYIAQEMNAKLNP